MADASQELLKRLASQDAVLVTVAHTRGSVPREAGAWMAVFAHGALGTVGGGRLELDASQHARALLQHAGGARQMRYPLGPALGQCCGGEVTLAFEPVSGADATALALRLDPRQWPVALFGGGHVGRAIATVLATLPLRLQWIDSREEIFPSDLPAGVQCEHSDPVHAAVATLPAQSRVLVMSFSHAEDLDIVAACLQRQRTRADLPYVGLIGSRSKWASFRHRLRARGFSEAELAHITCPIGIAGLQDKRPEVIAIAVAAQLLQVPG